MPNYANINETVDINVTLDGTNGNDGNAIWDGTNKVYNISGPCKTIEKLCDIIRRVTYGEYSNPNKKVKCLIKPGIYRTTENLKLGNTASTVITNTTIMEGDYKWC